MMQFREYLVATAILGVGVLSCLTGHWEMGGESWGYWAFARLFAETGQFNLIDRSPLYILYLNAFRWLGYPNAVTVEFVISGLIVGLGLVRLLQTIGGMRVAIFATFLWLPVLLLGMEPPPQKLALACCCFGVVIRQNAEDRRRLVASYALLLLAYFLRPSYLAVVFVFICWDGVVLSRNPRWRDLIGALRPRLGTDWPLLLALGLGGWFLSMQSPSRFNNAHFSSTTWFPGGSTASLADAHFIQGFNWKYIESKYGSFVGHDFYITNQELFKGATDVWGAVKANPLFLAEQISRNLKIAPAIILSFATELPVVSVQAFVISALLLGAVFYGAVRASWEKKALLLFVLGHLPLIISGALVTPESARHYCPMLPICSLSALWYAAKMREILPTLKPSLWLIGGSLVGIVAISFFLVHRLHGGAVTLHGLGFAIIAYPCLLLLAVVGSYGVRSADGTEKPWVGLAKPLVAPLVVVLLSSGAAKWSSLTTNLYADWRAGDIRVLELRGGQSMKGAYEKLKPLVQGKKGILSLEHNFVFAFMGVPMESIYDVWEIPPFGRLGDPAYDGLRPDRVDCVLVSQQLSTGVGAGTNLQLRFEGYIRPYVDLVLASGANSFAVDGFGQIVAIGELPKP
jgi:hypothetical protein